MTDSRMNVEQKANSTDLRGAEGISFKIDIVAVQPFHHVMRISVGFLDVWNCSIAENDASDDCFVSMFRMFCRGMDIEVLAEMFFVVGERFVC